MKKIILIFCLVTSLPLYPENARDPQETTSSSICEENPLDSDPINWKKILIVAGVFIIGVVTFSLVATKNNK